MSSLFMSTFRYGERLLPEASDRLCPGPEGMCSTEHFRLPVSGGGACQGKDRHSPQRTQRQERTARDTEGRD